MSASLFLRFSRLLSNVLSFAALLSVCLPAHSEAQQTVWGDVTASFEIALSNPTRNRRTQEATVIVTVTNRGDTVFQPLRLRIRDLTPASLGLREASRDDDGALVIGLGQGFGLGETRQLRLTFHNDAAPAPIDFDPRIEQFGDAPPRVVSVLPENGTQDVDPTTPIVLTFSEPLDIDSIVQDNFFLWSGGELIRPEVTGQVGNREVTLRADMPSDATVAVIVLSTVRDRMGTPMDSWFVSFLGTNNPPVGAPRIVAEYLDNIDPRPTALPPRFFQFAVDRPLDPNTLEGQLNVTINGEVVEGTLELVADDAVIQFTPDTPFAPGAFVSIQLLNGVTDLEGRALPSRVWLRSMPPGISRRLTRPEPWVFDPDTTDPVRAQNVQPMVLYNQHLEPSSVNEDTVQLYRVEDSGLEARVPAAVALEEGNRVRLLPAAPLQAGKQYRMLLTTGITDIDGDVPFGDRSLYFALADDAVVDTRRPRVMRMNPPNGATDLPTVSRFHVVFDEPISQATFPWGEGQGFGFTPDSRSIVFKPVPLLLPANSDIATEIPSVLDLAGNPLVPHEAVFTTGDTLSNGPAQLLGFSPSGARVPRNAVITLAYDKPLDPLSVSGLGVRSSSNTFGQVDTSLSVSGRFIHVVPRRPWEPGLYYRASGRLRDLETGESVEGLPGFWAGFEEDAAAPTLTMFNLRDGQEGVPNNVLLRIRFDEPVDMADLVYGGRVQLRDAGGELVPFNTEFDADHSGVLLTPVNLLRAFEEYELSVANVVDLSGNRLSQPSTIRFTSGATVDVVPPQSVSQSPPSGAALVPLNGVVQMLVDEPLDPVSVGVGRVEVVSVSVVDGSRGARVLLSGDGRRVTQEFDQHFLAGAPHSYLFGSFFGGITDLAGNSLAQTGAVFTAGFSADDTPPLLRWSSPPADSVDVPVNARITFQFDDALSPVCLSGAFSVNGHPVNAVSVDEKTVELTLDYPLAPSTNHTVTGAGVCNLAGLETPTFSQSFSVSSLGSVDEDPPTILSIDPADGASDIPTDQPIVIEFSEAIDPTSLGHLTIEVDGGPVPGAFSVDGPVVTFTPDAAIPQVARIHVRNTGVADLAGNASNNSAIAFTTAGVFDTTAPTVEAVSPTDGSVDGLQSFGGQVQTVTLRFSEPMNADTLNADNLLFWIDGEIVRPTISRSTDNRSVFLEGNYVIGDQVVVIVLSGVTDLSGNALAAPFLSTFFVEQRDPPRVTNRPRVFSVRARYPLSSTGRDFERIVLLFTEPLDPATVEHNVNVTGELGLFEWSGIGPRAYAVPGEVKLSEDNMALTFIPDEPFVEGRTHTLVLDAALRSASGSRIQLVFPLSSSRANVFEFRKPLGPTGSTPGVPPSLTHINPSNGSIDVPLNLVPEVRFSQPLDPSTVTTNNFRLLEEASQDAIDISLELVGDGRVVRILPSVPLAAGQRYRVSVAGCCSDTQLTDVDGDRFFFGNASRFTMSATGEVDHRRPRVVYASPPSGSVDVPRNARLSFRLDEPLNELALVGMEGRFPGLQISDDGMAIEYTLPGVLMPADSQVTVEVPPLEDRAGNLVEPFTIQFDTSAEVDVSSQFVLYLSPGNFYRENIPVNSVIQFQIAFPLNAANFDSREYALRDSTASDVPFTAAISEDGRRVVLTPDQPLLPGERYRVGLGGSVRDFTGRGIPLISTASFTTSSEVDLDPPALVDSLIQDGQTAVPTNLNIGLVFDERIHGEKAIANEEIRLFDVNGARVPLNITVDASAPEVVSFNNRLPLQPNASYSLHLGVFEDVSGNAVSLDKVLSFTTAALPDAQGADLLDTQPVDGASDVPTDVVLEWRFSEPVQAGFLRSDDIRLLDVDGNFLQNLPGTLAITDGGTRVRLTPLEALPGNSRIHVEIGMVKDLAGNLWQNPMPLRFQTGTTGGGAP